MVESKKNIERLYEIKKISQNSRIIPELFQNDSRIIPELYYSRWTGYKLSKNVISNADLYTMISSYYCYNYCQQDTISF
jgi:hypothetical protein